MWMDGNTSLNYVFICETCTWLLTPWSRDFLEKLIVTQLSKEFPPFMEPEFSLPCSQGLPLVPVLNQMHSVRNIHTISLISIIILFSHLSLGLSSGLFQLLRWKFCMRYSSFPNVLHAQHIHAFGVKNKEIGKEIPVLKYLTRNCMKQTEVKTKWTHAYVFIEIIAYTR
jgi:hypothetical protein